ncbi:hypothetical protein A1O7_03030 [Cladophialophora yegresii CBS 114405]|uniref:Cation efflux protein transmembrane domain-containing protein n=1 Tax=Cladophialophora yegresii CBS 114405 TaxID=1182544 RepID=W9W3F7_9EURO|nr:uncharacterized protein A1O7_03030 [Cladophialophora yegresii CBS 114405]EXJ62592.1 hypothetical protein A1O7_03030 [Cladophialophora yegresii CBS 114405]
MSPSIDSKSQDHIVQEEPPAGSTVPARSRSLEQSNEDQIASSKDPYSLQGYKVDSEGLGESNNKLSSRRQTRVKKYYNRQNALIDAYLGSNDEEKLEAEDRLKNGGKVRFAVNASFACNFCLFVIQMYAAISTGSPALFATAADAFMDLVSSVVMLITTRMGSRPKLAKFPVGRKRVETVGIILFCALMTTVAVQLIIESARALGRGAPDTEPLAVIPITFVSTAIFSKGCLFVYCFLLRRYPAARIFMIDHRNDIAVNLFGLTMSIVGSRFSKVWYLDPVGAICIALLILWSWASTAFEHMWYLVGKSAPQDMLNKLVYVSVTHDARIQKIDTVRAYHAGEKFYAEVDIVMAETEPLKVTHDVSQSLQRKLEGLADVERAFVHVDYEAEHDVHEEHRALYKRKENSPVRSAEEVAESEVKRGVLARLLRR